MSYRTDWMDVASAISTLKDRVDSAEVGDLHGLVSNALMELVAQIENANRRIEIAEQTWAVEMAESCRKQAEARLAELTSQEVVV